MLPLVLPYMGRYDLRRLRCVSWLPFVLVYVGVSYVYHVSKYCWSQVRELEKLEGGAPKWMSRGFHPLDVWLVVLSDKLWLVNRRSWRAVCLRLVLSWWKTIFDACANV